MKKQVVKENFAWTGKDFEKKFHKFRDYDLLTCLLALVGLLTSIVEYEYTFRKANEVVEKYPRQSEN
jgi:hypothetical protein